MENRNDFMPGRAFVLGNRAGSGLFFLLLLLALSGQTAAWAQSANRLTSKPATRVPDNRRLTRKAASFSAAPLASEPPPKRSQMKRAARTINEPALPAPPNRSFGSSVCLCRRR